MAKEYTSTLRKLKQMKDMADDVNLTLNRQIDFDDKVKSFLDELIETIEGEGTEAEG